MVQSRGGKSGYPARWVTRCVPNPITMRTNGSYIPLRFPGRRTMQSDGQINDSPGTMGNGNVFHGCGKPPELNGRKYPFVVLSAVCVFEMHDEPAPVIHWEGTPT